MVSIDKSDKTSTSEISSFDFVTEQRILTHIYKQRNIICSLIPFTQNFDSTLLLTQSL